MIWTAFYWKDYIADTAHLSLAEHGAYLLLMAHYYQHGSLPASAMQVHRICRAFADAERDAIDVVLKQFFVLDGDHYVNARIEEELSKTTQLTEKRKLAAKKRWDSKNASASDLHMQVHTQSHTHTHIENTYVESDDSTPLLLPDLPIKPDSKAEARNAVKEVFAYYCEKLNRMSAYVLTEKRMQQGLSRLKEFTALPEAEGEISKGAWAMRKCIDTLAGSDYHVSGGYTDWDNLFRSQEMASKWLQKYFAEAK